MSENNTGDNGVPNDDALLDALQAELAPEPSEPDADRVASLRALVNETRAEAEPAPVIGLDSARSGRRRRSERAPGNMSRRLLTAAAAVVLLAVGGVAGVAIDRSGSEQEQNLLARGTAEFEATLMGDGVEVEIDGAKAPEGRIVTLRSPSLPVLPVGEFYELWFLDGQGERISAGTFHPDTQGDTVVVLHAAVDPQLAGDIEITHESSDGNPEPSGDVVAQGSVRLD